MNNFNKSLDQFVECQGFTDLDCKMLIGAYKV